MTKKQRKQEKRVHVGALQLFLKKREYSRQLTNDAYALMLDWYTKRHASDTRPYVL